MFPITNNSPHFFTTGDVAKLCEFVTVRTLDEIKSAEITATEITCATDYSTRTFALKEIFPATSGSIYWEPEYTHDGPQETYTEEAAGASEALHPGNRLATGLRGLPSTAL